MNRADRTDLYEAIKIKMISNAMNDIRKRVPYDYNKSQAFDILLIQMQEITDTNWPWDFQEITAPRREIYGSQWQVNAF